jgi:O-antigen ligase
MLPRVEKTATGMLAAVYKVERRYAPDENLDFSIRQVELDLLKDPETYPHFDFDLDLMNLDDRARRERWESLFDPDEDKFQTLEGRRGAHANEWRLTFWLRSFYYTWRHAPLFGIGFGQNITNLNRQPPDLRSRESFAWRMFIPAMSVQNRNPHCAHLTVFTRLGLLGLALWLAILLSILAAALRSCWVHARAELKCRAENRAEAAEAHRCAFWDTLTVLGVWLIYLTAMSFGVVLENPMGGMWFWALTGVLAFESLKTTSTATVAPPPSAS